MSLHQPGISWGWMSQGLLGSGQAEAVETRPIGLTDSTAATAAIKARRFFNCLPPESYSPWGVYEEALRHVERLSRTA